MFTSKYELKKAGLLDAADFFNRSIRFEELTGQESGVWFDYNGETPFVKCDNFSGCELFEGRLNNWGEPAQPQLVRIDVDFVNSEEILDADDYRRMEANGAEKEDIEALKASDCQGAFYRLKVQYYDHEGEEKEYLFFAPEGWN